MPPQSKKPHEMTLNEYAKTMGKTPGEAAYDYVQAAIRGLAAEIKTPGTPISQKVYQNHVPRDEIERTREQHKKEFDDAVKKYEDALGDSVNRLKKSDAEISQMRTPDGIKTAIDGLPEEDRNALFGNYGLRREEAPIGPQDSAAKLFETAIEGEEVKK